MKETQGDRNTRKKMDDLKCICGSDNVYYDIVTVDGMQVNQVYCTECGIIMRSPASDNNGKWLTKNWERTLMSHIPGKPESDEV